MKGQASHAMPVGIVQIGGIYCPRYRYQGLRGGGKRQDVPSLVRCVSHNCIIASQLGEGRGTLQDATAGKTCSHR